MHIVVLRVHERRTSMRWPFPPLNSLLFFLLLQENGKTWTNRHLRLLHRIAMLVIVFASTTSASICRNYSVSILKEPKSCSFIALKTIFIIFREKRLALISKRFGSSNFTWDISLTNRVRGPYFKIRTEFFPLGYMTQGLSVREKRDSITYRSDREKRG